jgi:hypothetical protein
MEDPTVLIRFVPLLGAGLALLALMAAYRAGRKRRLIDNIPTSKTTGVFIGLVEIKGHANTAKPVASYLSGKECVCFYWRVEEHWSRTVVETERDSDGHTRTKVRHESGWQTVAKGGEEIPFYLCDECGEVLVMPEGAKIEPRGLFDETCGRGDPLYYAKGPPGAISNSDHRRHFVETGIPVGTELYIVGQARERKDVVAPEIAQDKAAPLFLISTRTEKEVSAGYGRGFWGWTFVALLLFVGSLVGRDLAVGQDPETNWPTYVLGGLGAIGAAVIAWVWMAYNGLIDLRQRVRQAWSQVDVQLTRRHDLIPNLVNIVKESARHEQDLQREVADLRTQLAATPPGVAGPDYQGMRNIVAAIAEKYPELKANDAFATLQQNLIDTEQRIALARGYFNEIATHFNTRLEQVPEKLVARLARMQPQTLMAANDFERAPVDVSFGPAPVAQAG